MKTHKHTEPGLNVALYPRLVLQHSVSGCISITYYLLHVGEVTITAGRWCLLRYSLLHRKHFEVVQNTGLHHVLIHYFAINFCIWKTTSRRHKNVVAIYLRSKMKVLIMIIFRFCIFWWWWKHTWWPTEHCCYHFFSSYHYYYSFTHRSQWLWSRFAAVAMATVSGGSTQLMDVLSSKLPQDQNTGWQYNVIQYNVNDVCFILL